MANIFISAGEASGEHYGALLVAELRRQLEASGGEAGFFGMGGARMRAAGLECIVPAEEMAIMGLTEVLKHLPHIWRELNRLKQSIRDRRPAVAILIDFPDLHFRIAAECHRLGIPVIFFVSPQLWAWKKHRIKLVQKYVDRMLVIFPFEEPYYRQRGVEAEFVGHPLAELPLPAVSREELAAAHGLDPARTWIGLLPGSRAKEIRSILPDILTAARELTAKQDDFDAAQSSALQGHGFSRADEVPAYDAALAAEGSSGANPPQGLKPDLLVDDSTARLKPCPFKANDSLDGNGGSLNGFEFLIPLAPTLTPAQRAETRTMVEKFGDGLPVHLVEDARAVLHHARASIVASGTATLEAALIGNPFVVVYRVSPLTYAIAKRLVKVDHVAMVNLIAEKRVVPELIQDDFTASNIVQQIGPLLHDRPARQTMMDELARIRGLLHTGRAASGAIERVAAVALELMGSPKAQFQVVSDEKQGTRE